MGFTRLKYGCVCLGARKKRKATLSLYHWLIKSANSIYLMCFKQRKPFSCIFHDCSIDWEVTALWVWIRGMWDMQAQRNIEVSSSIPSAATTPYCSFQCMQISCFEAIYTSYSNLPHHCCQIENNACMMCETLKMRLSLDTRCQNTWLLFPWY